MRSVSLLIALTGAACSVCGAATGCGGGGDSDPPDAGSTPTVWTDVTAAAGLPWEGYQCVAWDDFDRDGRPDLLLGTALPGLEAQGPLAVFRNRGDGTFEKIPIPVTAAAMVCEVGDLTGDGELDVVVGHYPSGVTLLRGLGGFAFETLPAPPLAPHPEADGVITTTLFDFDDDGWLDLFLGLIGNIADVDACTATADDFTCAAVPLGWEPSRLWHNQAGAGFTEGPAPGDPTSLAINSAAVIDWDGDGRRDLFVTHDFAPNGLYRNTGAGFEDLAPGLGLDAYNHGMGSAFGDFDDDGVWDLYVADLGPDRFYFGADPIDRAPELGIADWTRLHSGWSPIAADFDLDGRLDLFVVNSALVFQADEMSDLAHANNVSPGRQADFLYRNTGSGFVLDVIDHVDGAVAQVAAAAAASADFDGDGDLDIAEFYAPYHVRLLRNDTPTAGHWLVLDFSVDAADSIGAIVELRAGGRIQRRIIGPSGSTGRSWRAAHFGLGSAARFDEVTVTYPDGEAVTLPGSDADRLIPVVR